MPRFIDLFMEVLRAKKTSMREKLGMKEDSIINEALKAVFDRNWHQIPREDLEEVHVFAVDGSRAMREYVGGARFYVTRAFGVTNKGEKARLLDSDVFYARGREEEVQGYISLKTEFVEMKLALQNVKKLKGDLKFILIDGSLYGRMSHLFREFPVDGDSAFSLDYIKLYSELLEKCKENNIHLVGVSKDSRANFTKTLLLKELFSEELKALKETLTPEERLTLSRCFKTINTNPNFTFEKLTELKKRHGRALEKMEAILLEARIGTDFQMISHFASSPGYTTPVELGAQEQAMTMLKNISRNAEGYVRHNFKNAIVENYNRRDEFLREAVETIRLILNFPTVVSFHVLFDPRDTPIRVDVPSWDVGLDNTMRELTGNLLLYEFKEKVEEVLRLLLSGYGGLRNYNVWLKYADDMVKLHLRDVDDIYERALERELGFLLIHTRGYRRVQYP